MQDRRYSVPALLILAHATADILLCFSKVIHLTDELGDLLGLRGLASDVFRDLPENLFFGCVIGQVGLLGVWLALGGPPLSRRLGLVLWISACLWTLCAFAQVRRKPTLAGNLEDAADAAQWSLSLVVLVVLCTLRWRRRGWRLAWVQESQTQVRLPTRFSIAQVLMLMLLVGVMLETVEWKARFIAVGAFGCLFTMLGLWMAWAGASLTVRWIAATILSLALGMMLAANAPHMRNVVAAGVLSLSGTVTVGVTTLVLNRAGYGLVARAVPAPASGQEDA